jgi:hypothetical protein
LAVSAWLVVGAFGLIYGLASIGIAKAFPCRGPRLVLNILAWIVLIAAAVAIRFSSS